MANDMVAALEPGPEEIPETTDPVQLLPYLPQKLKDCLAEHFTHDPQLFAMSENELEKHLKSQHLELGNRDDALRARFWYIYDIAAYEMKEMRILNLCLGIVDPSLFYTVYVKNRFKMAWMVCKPTELRIQDLALITAGKRRMTEVLRMETKDPVTQKLDYKLIALQMSILKNLEDRVFGLPVKKVEQKNLNVHTEVSNSEMQRELENQNAGDLRAKLQYLQKESTKVLPATSSTAAKPVTVEVKKNNT